MSQEKSSINYIIPIIVGILGIGMGLAAGVGFGFLIGSASGVSFEDTDEYRQHFDIEIVEFEKRGQQVYLKFLNSGDEPIDDIYFEIEVRRADGKLSEEYEVQYSKLVKAGETEETILKPYDDEMLPVKLDGEVSVEFKYGWRTMVER